MSDRCDICRGNRVVLLPIYQRSMAVGIDEEPPAPRANSREFPCPQCCEVVMVGQIGAAHEETFVASYIDDPSFLDHVKEGLACAIGAQLLKSGYIKFRRSLNDLRELRFEMVATVGVVHPSKLDTLEQRIAERQSEVAQEVACEAVNQIDNWGSYYGHAEVLKHDARRLIGEALKSVLNRRAVGQPRQGGRRA